jgi:hypothetical protein
MATFQDTMITKLRTHYASPAGNVNDLLKSWRTDNAVDGYGKPTVGYVAFILASIAAGTNFQDKQVDYWVNVYV